MGNQKNIFVLNSDSLNLVILNLKRISVRRTPKTINDRSKKISLIKITSLFLFQYLLLDGVYLVYVSKFPLKARLHKILLTLSKENKL